MSRSKVHNKRQDNLQANRTKYRGWVSKRVYSEKQEYSLAKKTK